jgi:hypothetical protein
MNEVSKIKGEVVRTTLSKALLEDLDRVIKVMKFKKVQMTSNSFAIVNLANQTMARVTQRKDGRASVRALKAFNNAFIQLR